MVQGCVFGCLDLTTLSHIVLKPNSLQSGYLLAIVVQPGVYIHQMDVDTAFLYALSMSPIWLRYPMAQTFYLVTTEYTIFYNLFMY